MGRKGPATDTGIPEDETWRAVVVHPTVVEESFARRSRVLLRSAPLHRMRELQGRQSWDPTRSYDPLVLALAGLDAVISRSGLPDELDFDDLVGVLGQLASVAEPAAGSTEWSTVAEWVVRSLLGDGDTVGFTAGVGDYRAGYRVDEFRWQLLIERMRADGRVVLEATTEAINSLRTGLDLDVEDAQLAQETVLAAQLRRGDLRGAEASAEEGLRLSVELASKLRELLDATRINLDTVDWEGAFQARVVGALDHVAARIEVEHMLLEHLGGGADVDDESVRDSTRRIRDLLERCLARHRDLHLLLQVAPRTFLDEQLRQSLAGRRRSRVRIDVREQLVVPSMGANAGVAEACASAFAAGALGAQRLVVLRLDTLVERLLRPAAREPEPELEHDPLEDIVDEPDDDVADTNLVAAADALSRCALQPRLLSALLTEAPSAAVSEVVRLCALLLFDPDDLDTDDTEAATNALAMTGVADLVAVRAGDSFAAAGYVGDDLLLGTAVDLLAGDADEQDAETFEEVGS